MNEFLDINNSVLKLAGMWIPESNASRIERIFYYVYNTTILLCSCILYPICECMKFKESLSDMTVFMFYIKMVTTHIWGFVKLVLWHYKRAELFKVLDTLRSSTDEQDLCTSDKLKKSWKNDVLVNRVRTMILTSLAGCISIAGCIEAFTLVMINADSLYENSDEIMANSTVRIITKKLPYLSWIPFEYQHSRIKYLLAILFQWYGTFQQGILIAAFDFYYVSILSFISVQFRLVQKSFRSIRKRSTAKLGINRFLKSGDCPLLTKEMNYEMKRLTIGVQVLIKTCEDMEELFTYYILGQTMYSLGSACSCIFMVTTVPIFSMTFLMEMVFLAAVTCELFFFSYFGTKVTNDAQDIPNALFYSEWYTSAISFKRSILINMTRLQKPIYFSIGKFQPISLSTFVSIFKAAYSFCAVVKTMRSE